MRLRLVVALLVGLSLSATTLLAAPLTVERRQLQTVAEALTPSVAFDAGLGFVITWQERSAEGASLHYMLLDVSGQERRRGRIAGGKDWFVNWADFPSLAVLDNGDWVSHWLQKSAAAPYAYDIRIVRSQDQGRTWSAPITPHRDGTPTEHGFVSFVPRGDDKVLVVWLDGRKSLATAADGQDHGNHATHGGHGAEGIMTLRAATLDRRAQLSDEFELDASTCSCCQTDAARHGHDTLVAYRNRTRDEIRDIATVTRSSSGKWSAPAIVHADQWRIEGCPVNGPALATNGNRQLIVWPTGAKGSTAVHYLLRDGDRAVARIEVQPGSRMLGRVDASAWGEGFLLSWIGTNNTQTGLLVAEVSRRGELSDSIEVAPVSMTRLGGNPRMASGADRAVVAWTEPAVGKSGQHIAYAILSKK